MAFSAIPLFYYKEFYMNVQPKLENYYLCLKANLNFDTYNSLTPNWYYKVLR